MNSSPKKLVWINPHLIENDCQKRRLKIHTDLSKSNMKHLLTSSFVGLQPQRSLLDVKSENLEYVKWRTAASSSFISLTAKKKRKEKYSLTAANKISTFFLFFKIFFYGDKR